MSEPSLNPVERTESLPVPGLPEDWHLKATERIVSTVDNVRVKTSGPAIKVSRAVVFGLLGAILSVIALIVFVVGLVRLLDIALPGTVWAAYFALSAFFLAIGAFLWSRRPRGAAS